jgi:hypothetical protein
MASPNASFAAYNQLTPLADKVTQNVQYWNEDGFARRQEKRLIDQNEADKKAKADKKKGDLRDKVLKNIQNYDTGSRSLNEVQGRLIQQAKGEYIGIIKTLEDPNTSEDDILKTRLRLQELHSLPEKLKLVTDFYTNQDSAYKTAKESGAIFENEDYEKSFQGGFENFVLDLDDMGNPVVAFKDTNNDGVVDVKDVQTYDQIKTALNNGQGTFDFQKKFNIDAITTDIADKMGTQDITTTKGAYSSSQEKQVKKEELKTAINRLLYKNGEVTGVMKSALREKGLENTPENQKLVSDEIYKITEGKTDYLKKDNKKPYPVRGSGSSKGSKSSFGQAVVPTEQTWKDAYKSLDTKNFNSVSVRGPKIEALETGDGRTLTNANIVNYTYNTDGDLVLDVYHQDEKSSAFSKEKKNELLVAIEALERMDNKTDEQQKELKDAELELSKINKGPSNLREVVTVAKEDEANVAGQMGMSIEDMKQRASKNPDKATKDTENNQGIGSKYNKP